MTLGMTEVPDDELRAMRKRIAELEAQVARVRDIANNGGLLTPRESPIDNLLHCMALIRKEVDAMARTAPKEAQP